MATHGTSVDGKETQIASDGPLINGRPALTIKHVQTWFKDAYGIIPSEDDATPIAEALNHCAFLEAHWKDTPDFKKMRRTNPSHLRMQRISAALTTLQKDLPSLIDDTLKIRPNAESDALVPVRRLLDSANTLAPGFQSFKRPIQGREPALWHRIARNLGPFIITALKSSDVKRAGFGQPTSPAVKIMGSALKYLGVAASPEAIVDAMRGRRKPGKIRR